MKMKSSFALLVRAGIGLCVALALGASAALAAAADTTPVQFFNLATRAHVGTGDKVMIPGFVIGGQGSQNVLIRAVGPTLATFGVSDVLADPVLTLYREQTVLASNDNWSGASNAAQIASTAAAVGAFSLPAGSRDAALLVTLTPGNYSVVVSGAGGASGTALVELYRTGADAPPGTDAVFTASECLFMPTDRSALLHLVPATDLQLYAEFGTQPGVYTAQTTAVTARAGEPIEITLQSPNSQNPLLANTRHYYRVRYRAPGANTYQSRAEYSFVTQRPSDQSFVFTLTADPHLDEQTNPALLTQAMRNIRADAPDFHVDLGDSFMSDKLPQIIPGLKLTYEAIAERAMTFRGYFGEFSHSAPFFFVLGNHEAEYGYAYAADRTVDQNSNVASWDLRARHRHFPTPLPGSFYAVSSESRVLQGQNWQLRNYYAWEWGAALFVVLDPFWNTMGNPNSGPADNWRWSLGRTQYDWLKQTLQTSRARYKFVFIHHLVGGVTVARGGVEAAGRYEWGGKNVDGSEGFATRRPGWDMPVHQLLRTHKVSAVFHGHDHLYACQQLDGIVYQECPQPGTGTFNTGSQKEGEYATGTILPNSGHLRISVAPAATKVEYVRAVLGTQETATLRNRDVAHTYTLAPSN